MGLIAYYCISREGLMYKVKARAEWFMGFFGPAVSSLWCFGSTFSQLHTYLLTVTDDHIIVTRTR